MTVQNPPKTIMSIHTETLRIEGMSCSHCVRAVREALDATEGLTVESVEVGSAVVRWDDATLTREALHARIEEAGYRVVAAEPT